jgi:hypothetical protein
MSAGSEALTVLRSSHFFDRLRGFFHSTGPAREVKVAIGLFLILVSRFRAHPLRLYVEQQTPGSATHLVRRVAQLLPSGSVAGFSGDMNRAWVKFEREPETKVFYIPPLAEMSQTAQPRMEVHSNRITRVDSALIDGQITEQSRDIERPFVCISAERVADWNEQSRWLTMKLKAPVTDENDQATGPQASDLEVWHAMQDLIKERMQVPIRMPEWEEVVIEKIRVDRFATPHVAALLVLWKTMSALRSFIGQPTKEHPKVIRSNFEDYAVTAAVMKGLFLEGKILPSAQCIFDEVCKHAIDSSVINPLNGKGRRYTHPVGSPVFASLL